MNNVAAAALIIEALESNNAFAAQAVADTAGDNHLVLRAAWTAVHHLTGQKPLSDVHADLARLLAA